MASAEEPLAAMVKSVNDFTLKFYLATVEDKGPGKNVLVSPLSAALVTAMVHAGAKGETANEIMKGLHLPSDKNALEKGFKSLHEALANTPNVTLDVANSIFVEQTTKLKEDYRKTVSEVHNSDIQTADFIENAEKERDTINNWVAEKTHQKIKDLIPSGILNSLTRLVLVNAVYFYGKWKEQFDPQQTTEQNFYVTKTQTVKVPMMHLSKDVNYAEIPELDAKAVELCYVNEQVCMQIILPNAKDGLEGMQQKLRAGAFDLSKIHFYKAKVELSLPRFKLMETINVKTIFQKMGINRMFTEEANLTGIADQNLSVSHAMQKTFMEVNEEGTKAAAATAVVVMRCMAARVPRPMKIFKVEHPAMVRLMAHGVCVFTGSLASF